MDVLFTGKEVRGYQLFGSRGFCMEDEERI